MLQERLDDTPSEGPSVRLQKYLAAAGLGSRRHCEQYIQSGRVTVDGEMVSELGASVDPARQQVRVDGELVRAQPKRYFLLNKPPGYVCTTSDPAGRPRALDLVGDERARLFTVGRLDEYSRGLLLITNDGELANRLAHPRYGMRRVYRVQVAGSPTRDVLTQLMRGSHFAEGTFRAQNVRRVGSQGKSTFLEMTLTEGQNREIRRMLARVGHKVIDLERIAFGPLKLGRLPPGHYRPLRPSELDQLRDFAAGVRDSKRKAGPRSNRPKRARAKRSGKSPSRR
ncbi:MAG: pseudouridine synthase [Planctomycetaceae bacterium]